MLSGLSKQHVAVLGAGLSGESTVAFLLSKGCQVSWFDQLAQPSCGTKLVHPKLNCYFGNLRDDIVRQADLVVTSPGIPPSNTIIQAIQARKQQIITDLDIFLTDHADRTILVTGTNGKSTTVTLIGALLASAGHRVAVLGNIGTPLLSIPHQDYDWFVVEVSSYMLHYTQQVRSFASVILNLAPDHLAWHTNMVAYREAKQRVYEGTVCAVVNADQASLLPPQITASASFGSQSSADWWVHESGDIYYHQAKVISVADYASNRAGFSENIVAACALAHLADVPFLNMSKVIATFPGLAHRCELLGVVGGVRWFNDSKATNLHAVQSAINAFAKIDATNKVVLLLGGQLKADEPWQAMLAGLPKAYHVIIFGDAVNFLSAQCDLVGQTYQKAQHLEAACTLAAQTVTDGDVVLCSPGGASFDAFDNFEQRGEYLRDWFNVYKAQEAI